MGGCVLLSQGLPVVTWHSLMVRCIQGTAIFVLLLLSEVYHRYGTNGDIIKLRLKHHWLVALLKGLTSLVSSEVCHRYSDHS